MKKLISFILVLACVFFPVKISAQHFQSLILIEPTGDSIGGLPEMKYIPDTSHICHFADSVSRTTFIREAIGFFQLAQQYAFNHGEIDKIEPAFLAVTKNQGGFARQGFYLDLNDGQGLEKSRAHYVDLTTGTFTAPLEDISSVTQIYPHELMHAIYRMLCTTGAMDSISFNVNMHYFSVLTDFNTAFNEGFAEHMEAVSLMFEPNGLIKEGKRREIDSEMDKLRPRLEGFRRDCRWLLRPGYYKAIMLLWYQPFEDYKRNVHVFNDQATFVNKSPYLRSVRDMITWRNCGIEQDTNRKKNLVQLAASEGFISTYFTRLALSELPGIYRNADFYRQFRSDTAQALNPKDEISPLQNLFMKYFFVLHHSVKFEKSERAQLIDFIDGYCRYFPDEAHVLRRVFKDLTGQEYSSELPPPLWALVKDYDHPSLLMDPFGAITVPVYTFDINMAETEDFLTIKGIGRESAQRIVNFRNNHGLFHSWDEFTGVPGMNEEEAVLLSGIKMDAEYFNSIPEASLDIMTLITHPLLILLRNGMLFFIPFLGLILILYRKSIPTAKLFRTFIKYLFTWIFFMIAGLAAVIFMKIPEISVSIFILIYLLLVFFLLRKKKETLVKNLIVVGLMGLLTICFVI